jgi:hypothetical protein
MRLWVAFAATVFIPLFGQKTYYQLSLQLPTAQGALDGTMVYYLGTYARVEANGAVLSVDEGFRPAQYTLVITPEIAINSDKNAVRQLKLVTGQPYSAYRLTCQDACGVDAACSAKACWSIERIELPSQAILPEHTFIILLDPACIAAVGNEQGVTARCQPVRLHGSAKLVTLPTIAITQKLTEKQLHGMVTQQTLRSLDILPVHRSGTQQEGE